MTDCVVTEVADGIATVHLNRPHVRNAIDGDLLESLRRCMRQCDDEPTVGAIIITGTDPAFCAGLDLKALAAADPVLIEATSMDSHLPWAPTVAPVIGAINGPAVAGGLEFALNCDILIGSERATFADTHARVAVMPGWGLSARLPAAVGRQLANWMSLSGRPISANRAREAGLLCEVVPHQLLMASARSLAADIVAADRSAVTALLASYRHIERAVHGGAFDTESTTGREFRENGLRLSDIETSRQAIIDRGRALHGDTP